MKRHFLLSYAAIALITLAAFASGPGLAYLEILPPGLGFGIFLVSILISVPLVLTGATIISRNGATPAATVGTFASLVPAGFLIYFVATFYKFPLINDVSTDSAFAPQLTLTEDMQEDCATALQYPTSNRALIEQHYPDIQSLGLESPGDRIFGRIQDFVQDTAGWSAASTSLSESESILQAQFTSKIFHFVDDVAIHVTNVSGGGCVVDVHSRSRSGKGDLGANAEHIREVLNALQR